MVPYHNISQYGVRLEHFHSIGGAEAVSNRISAFLHGRGIATSHSPWDTQKMKSTVEWGVCDIKERRLSMLLLSTSPVPFW